MRYFFLGLADAPVETDAVTSARWMDSNAGRALVCLTHVGGMMISTKFIGYDPYDDDPPSVWETVVFVKLGGDQAEAPPGLEDLTHRYASRRDAEIGHAYTCRVVAAAVDEMRAPKTSPNRAIALGGIPNAEKT